MKPTCSCCEPRVAETVSELTTVKLSGRAPYLSWSARAFDDYEMGPDSYPQEGVPKGEVRGPFKWKSQIFEGTERDFWVYVPAGHKFDGPPAAVMVFQDGGGYTKADGQWRVPTVFDNLIHKKQMPPTVGIFINPGVIPALKPKADEVVPLEQVARRLLAAPRER